MMYCAHNKFTLAWQKCPGYGGLYEQLTVQQQPYSSLRATVWQSILSVPKLLLCIHAPHEPTFQHPNSCASYPSLCLCNKTFCFTCKKTLKQRPQKWKIFIYEEESQLFVMWVKIQWQMAKNLELSMTRFGCISGRLNNFSSFTISQNPFMCKMSLQALEFF
jgi:hypothetical protein